MNFMKFINSDYLKENPLCGIGTYKDELNLATGACTRQIKKFIFTGEENWGKKGNSNYTFEYSPSFRIINGLCSHYAKYYTLNIDKIDGIYLSNTNAFIITDLRFTTLTDFKAYLAAQYDAGTPITVWYVLATPTTETITVPSGLSGTEEGYLNQSGTPTPTNPIYPTANTVEKWFDLNHYIMGTSTDTLTTLPADIYANDTTATVGLKGNMEQSGTPTPDNPIQPSECGDLSGNLFDKYDDYYVGTNANNYTITGLKPNTRYTCSTNFAKTVDTASIYFGGGSSATNGVWANFPNTQISTSEGTLLLSLRFRSDAGAPAVYDDIMAGTIWVMVNEGSTPLPYEPYGVKIPISSANITTPVYLGEVQTTRRIKKLVLTGGDDENWNITNNSRVLYLAVSDFLKEQGTICYCTHYETINNVSSADDVNDGECTFNDHLNWLYIKDSNYTGAQGFKNYLTAQYAAGTPVTVWYVLATPSTGIVNEPIRKIGTYADEVSGITIPVTAGVNTLSVDTTLQPSEITVNYRGWHPVADVHERENGAWT